MDNIERPSRSLAILSVAYLVCAIAGASIIALQQMGQHRAGTADAAPVWLAATILAALAGFAGALMLARGRSGDATVRRVALVMMIFGAVIFSLISFALTHRGVPPGSHPAPLPRTGANI